jgi:uncharacterized protein YkwD
MRALGSGFTLALMLVFAACASDGLDAPPPGCGSETEIAELDETNRARLDAGVAPLACVTALAVAARKHAQDMCDQGYFDHVSLDGRSFEDRIRAEGVMFGMGGENIARGQPTAAAVHASWMMSDGHRGNILHPGYARIGIGHVPCPDGGGPFWVQTFAD